MLQAKLKEASTQLDTYTKELEAASTDLKKWSQAAKLLKKLVRRPRLTRRNSSLILTLRSSAQNKELEGQLSKLTEESKSEHAELVALKEQHSTVTARNATLETEFKALEEKWGQRLDEAEQKANAEKQELSAALTQLRTQSDSQVRARLWSEALFGLFWMLTLVLFLLQPKVQELEEQLAAKTKEFDAASTDLKKWMTAAKLLKKQNKEMEEQITDLSTKLKQSEAAPAPTAGADHTSAESDENELRVQLSMQRIEITALQNELQQLKAQAPAAAASAAAAAPATAAPAPSAASADSAPVKMDGWDWGEESAPKPATQAPSSAAVSARVSFLLSLFFVFFSISLFRVSLTLCCDFFCPRSHRVLCRPMQRQRLLRPSAVRQSSRHNCKKPQPLAQNSLRAWKRLSSSCSAQKQISKAKTKSWQQLRQLL